MQIKEAISLCRKHISFQEALWLLEKIVGKPSAQIIAYPELLLTLEQESSLKESLKLLSEKYMPLQYILKTISFNSLELSVKPPVLIPRPETAEWCLWLTEQLKKSGLALSIADVCTGSGCIAVACAVASPNSKVYALDISPDACTLAQENAQKNNVAIEVIQSDLCSVLPQKVDLIVSNPPYVSPDEWSSLEPRITQWEDPQALIAQGQGLACIKELICQAKGVLRANEAMKINGIPSLIIEIGHTQANAVQRELDAAGFKNIRVMQDSSGKDRVVMGDIA